MKPLSVIALVMLLLAAFLAFTNPTEAQFRRYVQERQGIVGVLGLGLADLLSNNSSKGVHRQSFIVCSKFYLGGDGILPRQDLAWGIAGKFIEIEPQR